MIYISLLLVLIIIGVIAYALVLAEPLTPGAAPVIRDSDSFEMWINNVVTGPVSAHELRDLRQTGRVRDKTLIRRIGSENWLPLSSFEVNLKRPSVVVSAAPVTASKEAGGLDLTKSGMVLLIIGVVLSLVLGAGLVEMLLIAAGVILLVVGLCKK